MGIEYDRLVQAAKLEKNGLWSELLAFAKEWAAMEPANSDAWQAIGDSHLHLSNLKEAASAYRKGLEFIQPFPADIFSGALPDGPNPFSGSGLWFRLGNVYNSLGEWEMAIDAFNEASRIDPKSPEILNNLGVAYVNANKLQEASEAFRSCVLIDQTNIHALTNWGIIYARCGVEQGVTGVYQLLSKVDANAANAFLLNAKKILLSR
jgi:tetratricopeptide (TPR) repeat protein